MESRKKCKFRGGNQCVAGAPGGKSCTNGSYTKGISMHAFPRQKQLLAKWVCFVRRHRANWKPSKSSKICSAHFAPECFTPAHSFSLEPSTSSSVYTTIRRTLKNDSVPTIDVASETSANTARLSQRERRKVYLHIFLGLKSRLCLAFYSRSFIIIE